MVILKVNLGAVSQFLYDINQPIRYTPFMDKEVPWRNIYFCSKINNQCIEIAAIRLTSEQPNCSQVQIIVGDEVLQEWVVV